MVDYNHLSEGNPSSSPSRDIFAEFGVTPQSLHSPGNSSDYGMDSSSDARKGGFEDVHSPNSVSSSDQSNDLGVGQDLNQTQISEIFKAAQQISYNDRLDAAETRKKNGDLLAFIEAMGHSLQDVNKFTAKSEGKAVVDDDNIRSVHLTESQSNQQKGFTAKATLPETPLERMDTLATGGNYSSGAVVGIAGAGNDRELLQPTENDRRQSRQNSPAPAGFPEKEDFPSNQKSWASVVQMGGNSSKVKLSFHPPVLSNGAVMIKPPTEVLKQGNSLWNTCLVGSFLHSRLPFKLVEETAHKLWGNHGLSKVLLHDKDFFLFKFSTIAECTNVLALGPWYMANKLLKLQLWKEGVDFNNEDSTRAPVWVKFHHIPLSYWTMEGLSYLASGIGKPLFVDKITEKLEPMKYARICIEIQASSNLPDSLFVTIFDDSANTEQTVEVKVEYQQKPSSCPTCLVFGHSQLKCPKANYQWVPKVAKSTTPDCMLSTDPVPAVMPSESPDIPSPIGNLGTLESKSEWHLVSKGSGAFPPASKTPVAAIIKGSKLCMNENSFSPLATSGNSYSEEESPVPNPLISRLLRVDEKEGKDQKNKARVSLDAGHSLARKKRSKGGGGNKLCLN